MVYICVYYQKSSIYCAATIIINVLVVCFMYSPSVLYYRGGRGLHFACIEYYTGDENIQLNVGQSLNIIYTILYFLLYALECT